MCFSKICLILHKIHDMKKYCAFGNWYKDNRGEILEESENFYIVKAQGWTHYLALSKDPRLTIVFDTEEERDNWIKDQNFQYDPR